MNKTSLKRNSGITLIALIITIVVLLILAGVAIGTLEKNDIIGRAKETTALYETRKAEEEQELATAEEFMKQYGKTEKRYYFMEDGYKITFVLTAENKIYQINEQNGTVVDRYEFGEFQELEVTTEIIEEVQIASEISTNISDYSKAIRFYPSDNYEVYMLISKDGKTMYVGEQTLKAE